MNKSLLLLIFIIIEIIFGEEEENVRSLCENPVIYSIDRLPNGSTRVYRDYHYWELSGLPDRVLGVKGPFKISHKYMAPVNRSSSIMTVLSGPIAGNTWKYDGERYWQWDPNGEQEIGGKGGSIWKVIPRGGFHCAMNDGDYDKKGYPRMIALKAIRAYYWRTSKKIFEPVGDIYQGYQGGQFEEKFPADITACTAFRSSDDMNTYHVYLFKRDKYCYRPIKGEEGCKEWRDNKELFGCTDGSGGATNSPDNGNVSESSGSDSSSSSGSDNISTENSPKPAENPNEPLPDPKTTKSNGYMASTSQTLLFSLVIYLFSIFQ